MEDTRKAWPIESTKQGSHVLTEIKTAGLGPAWVCIRSLHVCYGCLVSVFVGLITVTAEAVVFWLFACCWIFLSSPYINAFALPCLIVSCFVLFGFCLVPAVFWRGSGGGVDLEERKEVEGRLGGVEGLWLGCIEWEKNLFSIDKTTTKSNSEWKIR